MEVGAITHLHAAHIQQCLDQAKERTGKDSRAKLSSPGELGISTSTGVVAMDPPSVL